MNILFWIIGLLLLIFCIYMTVMNWAVFVNNHILKKKWTSAIPLVGGISGALGIICLPVEGSWKYLWIPLIVDWGSFPVIVVALISHLGKNSKGDRHF